MTDDPGMWKEAAKYLWTVVAAVGAYLWKKQDTQMRDLEKALDSKADKDEMDRQRDNISKLFDQQAALRGEMARGFGELKDIMHKGLLDITREVARKADK